MKTIQRAKKEDLEDILKLQIKAFTSVAELINTPDLPPLRQTIEELNQEYEYSIILNYLSEDGKIVGSVRGMLDDKNICHIGKLIVDPSFQNQGIGRKLMCEIENYFPYCTKFALFTGEATKNTVYLYQKIGYQITGKQLMGEINMYLMEKENRVVNIIS